MIFIHGTIVPGDNSIGKVLITGDNTISLLQNKCFSFPQVLRSVTCNISASIAKACKSGCKYRRLLTAYYRNGDFLGVISLNFHM